ncbi:MAG TPA: CHAT domain-containing protein [Capsulimonadaceae bacterium]
MDRRWYHSGVLDDYAGLGRAYSLVNREGLAEQYYVRAYRLAAGEKQIDVTPALLNQLGLSRWRQGRYQSALAALTYADAIGTRQLGDTVANNIGVAARATGDYELASTSFRRAERLADQLGHAQVKAAATANSGATYHSLGLYSLAVERYKSALALYGGFHDSSAQATLLANIAYAEHFQGHSSLARTSLKESIASWRALGNQRGLQSALSDLGRIEVETGQFRSALVLLGESIGLAGKLADRAGVAICLTDAATAYLGLHDLPKAEGAALRALYLLRSAPDPYLLARAEQTLMRIRTKQGRSSEAIFWGKQSANTVQYMKAHLSGSPAMERDSFAFGHTQVYRDLADLLISRGRLTEAQEVLKLLKSDEFDQYDRDGRVLVRGERPPVRDGEVLVRGDRPPVRDGKVLVRGERPPVRSNVGYTGIPFTADERHFSGQLARAKSEVAIRQAAIDGPWHGTQSIASAQSATDGLWRRRDVAAVSVLVTGEGVRTILRTIDGTYASKTAISPSVLNKAVFDFRQSLEDPSSDPRHSAAGMYNLILPPNIDARLKSAKVSKIEWSLDGVLRYVPVAALYDGQHYVAESWESAYEGSMSKRSKTHNGAGCFAAGVSRASVAVEPITGDTITFAALPSVPTELKAVAGATRAKVTLLLDNQFSVGASRSELQLAKRYVHIASHFHLTPGDSARSYLLLGNNHLLSVSSLSRIPRVFSQADLVTFSACSTAAQGNGIEVDGLAGIACKNGARSVLATLWPVDDPTISRFMRDFYGTLSTNCLTSQALRSAQLDMLNGQTSTGKRHPYYWASYVAYENQGK